jgi:hypothetical protein
MIDPTIHIVQPQPGALSMPSISWSCENPSYMGKTSLSKLYPTARFAAEDQAFFAQREATDRKK